MTTLTVEERMARVANGESQYLDFNGAILSPAQTEQLVETLHTAPEIIRLTFRGGNVAHFKDVAEAIKTRSDIQELRFSTMGLSEEESAEICGIIGNNPKLRQFGFVDNNINRLTFEKIAQEIGDARGLHYIDFTDCKIDDDNATTLLTHASRNPNLIGMNLGHNPIGEAVVPALVAFVQRRPNLVALDLGTTGLNIDELVPLDKALLVEPHPNLLHYNRNQESPDITRLMRHNNKQTGDLRGELTVPGLARIRTDLIWAATERKTAILHQEKSSLRYYDRNAADTYPVLGADDAVTLDALFTPDANQHTAIENPRTWEAHPDLLEKLGERGELSPDALNRQTPQGYTLLDHALGFTPLVADIVATLNRHGVRLQADLWLDAAESAPSPRMEFLAERGQLAAIFKPDNWQGAPKGKLIKMLETAHELSPEERYPNPHSLMLAVERQARASEKWVAGR